MIASVNRTKEILNKYDLYAKKGFGQNFLIDSNIVSKIVSSACVDENTGVIEIGPGLGALTEKLCMSAKKVLCYEIDSDMVEVLNNEHVFYFKPLKHLQAKFSIGCKSAYSNTLEIVFDINSGVQNTSDELLHNILDELK